MTYSEPVSQLLKLGAPGQIGTKESRKWLDYTTLGLSEKDIPQLIELLSDWELYDADEDSTETWASLHAWRALGQLKAPESIPALIQMLEELEDDNDWAREEMPVVFGMIGEESIPILTTYLCNNSRMEYVRIAAAHGIAEVGTRVSSKKEECIKILSDFITQSSTSLSGLNGLIVCYLMDLKAKTAIESIRKAIEEGVVDISIPGDLEDIEIGLGLRESRSTPRPNYNLVRHFYSTQKNLKQKKIGRNEPCPCGSGKKYKKCCLQKSL